jgi:hypothetical protein
MLKGDQRPDILYHRKLNVHWFDGNVYVGTCLQEKEQDKIICGRRVNLFVVVTPHHALHSMLFLRQKKLRT